MRKNVLTLSILAASSTLLLACGGDSDDDNGESAEDDPAQVRVVHAVSDAPDVNAGLNGGSQVEDLAFGNATGYLEVDEGDYDVSVDGILPVGADNDTVNVISADGVPLAADNETSIFAVGTVGSIEPLVVTAPDADPASDEVRVQVVHASAAAEPAGDLDVYVTAPDADLSDEDPIGTFGFKEDLGPLTVPAGDYQIRVTPTGSTDAVFDSGSVALAGGSDLVIGAIDNVGPGDSPVRLLVAPEGGDSFELLDAEAPAAVGAAHFSADTPEVDVALNGEFGPPAVEGLAFTEVTGFLDVPADEYDIDVAPSGNTEPAVEADAVELTAGNRFTGYAVGLLGGDPDLELILSQDDIRSVATEARLRVVHAASQVPGDGGPVDVYLTPEGTTADDLGGIDPVLSGFEYKEITEFLSVAPGTYEVFVTPEGTTTAAIGPVTVELEGGDVTTAIARDDDNDVGGSFALTPVDETAR